jgi:hypothetical protein
MPRQIVSGRIYDANSAILAFIDTSHDDQLHLMISEPLLPIPRSPATIQPGDLNTLMFSSKAADLVIDVFSRHTEVIATR